MPQNPESMFATEREYHWALQDWRDKMNKLDEFVNKLTLLHFGLEFEEIDSSSNLEKLLDSEEEKRWNDIKEEYKKKMEELDNKHKKIKSRKPLHVAKEWEEKEAQFQETLEVIRGI